MLAALIFVPLFAMWPGFILAGIGLLFAPIAAIDCMRSAQSNGLNARRYAIMGGVYSLVFFVPSVYLLARLRGKVVSRKLIMATYIALHVYWVLVPLGFAFVTSFAIGPGMFLLLFFIWVASLCHLI